MEELVTQARKDGAARNYTRDQLRELFKGDDGDRIVALGRMQGNLDAADFHSAIEAIVDSRSAFEQYQGIVLTEQLVPRLGESEKRELATICGCK